MKLKNIILVLVPLLLVIILTTTIYTAFKGNPFEANKATIAIEEYVKEKYSQYDLEVEQAVYNFKFKSYACKVYSNDIVDLHFRVKYNKQGNISYDSYEPDYLGGYNTLERFGDEYTALVMPIINNLFGEENINRAYIEYEKDNLAEKSTTPQPDQRFDPNDSYNKRIMVNINGESATAEDFNDKLQELKKAVEENNNYKLDDYTLYIEIDGRAYSVRDISPELINDELLDNIKKKAAAPDDESVDVGFKVSVQS